LSPNGFSLVTALSVIFLALEICHGFSPSEEVFCVLLNALDKTCSVMFKILDCVLVWPELGCIWCLVSLWCHHSSAHSQYTEGSWCTRDPPKTKINFLLLLLFPPKNHYTSIPTLLQQPFHKYKFYILPLCKLFTQFIFTGGRWLFTEHHRCALFTI